MAAPTFDSGFPKLPAGAAGIMFVHDFRITCRRGAGRWPLVRTMARNRRRRIFTGRRRFSGRSAVTPKPSRAGGAQAEVVVAVAGVVVVAIGSANVPGVVVPRAAAINPVGALVAIDR
ncbi:MAG TPA: hypothetical protein PKH54_04985 [Myxococcota bacterium]|nr:hypothetical protein [Myxococcota bacterium]